MKYIVDHIPKNTPNNRRPGNPMNPQYITIHNTGNPSSTARNERGWLTNPSNNRTASYHIVVDEKEAIECIPLNENAWHAGDGNGDGNRKSIGIEICESGNYEKALDNAVKLVASMLIERQWYTPRLKRHWDWSKKICPRLMYDNGDWKGWHNFLERVRIEMAQVEKKTEFVDVPAGHWAEESIAKANKQKVIVGISDSKFGLGQPVTREQLAVIFDRVGLLDKKEVSK